MKLRLWPIIWFCYLLGFLYAALALASCATEKEKEIYHQTHHDYYGSI